MNPEFMKPKPMHKTECSKCKIKKLTQYKCTFDGEKMICDPIERFFRVCDGYNTVEVKDRFLL
jgi:hypothetical protein